MGKKLFSSEVRGRESIFRNKIGEMSTHLRENHQFSAKMAEFFNSLQSKMASSVGSSQLPARAAHSPPAGNSNNNSRAEK